MLVGLDMERIGLSPLEVRIGWMGAWEPHSSGSFLIERRTGGTEIDTV